MRREYRHGLGPLHFAGRGALAGICALPIGPVCFCFRPNAFPLYHNMHVRNVHSDVFRDRCVGAMRFGGAGLLLLFHPSPPSPPDFPSLKKTNARLATASSFRFRVRVFSSLGLASLGPARARAESQSSHLALSSLVQRLMYSFLTTHGPTFVPILAHSSAPPVRERV